MPRHAGWVVVLALAGCGPDTKGGELFIEVTPVPVSTDGKPSTIRVVASRSDGLVGTGNVRVKSSAGSLVDGETFALDAFGTVVTPFSCNQAVDVACAENVSVDAEWLLEGTSSVKASRNVSVSRPNTTGGIGGVGGTGGSGGSGGSGSEVMTCGGCTGSASMYRFGAFGGSDGRLVDYWFSLADRQIGAQSISGSEITVRRQSCTDGKCTRIELLTGEISLSNGAPASNQYGITRHTVEFGGSMDNPELMVGRYTDGKRRPPVTFQPFFDTNICPDGTVTTFEVCTLDVEGASVKRVAVQFDFAICVGAQVERKIRGCALFAR